MQADTTQVSRRVLDCFGYTIASVIALDHASTAVVALGRSGGCAANLKRCRKYGLFTSYDDTGLMILRMHADTAYAYVARRILGHFGVHDSVSDGTTPCQNSHGSVWLVRGVCRERAAVS